MKPLPKVILIVAVVAAIGVGLSRIDMKSMFKKPDADAIAEVPIQVSPVAAAPAPVEPPPAPPLAASQPVQTPPSNNVTSGDAGLNAVLSAGKK